MLCRQTVSPIPSDSGSSWRLRRLQIGTHLRHGVWQAASWCATEIQLYNLTLPSRNLEADTA